MKKLAVVLLLLMSTPVHAYQFAEKWTWADTSFEAAFVAVTLVDWGQTRTQAKNNWIIDEMGVRIEF